MSESEDKHDESNDESEEEPDEDPKLMLLVEAGLVPGLDDNLQHLKTINKDKKKKKKNKKRRRRKQQEEQAPPAKKLKREIPDEDGYVINKIISNLNKPSKYQAYMNCLMLSEWLVKIPEDFEENWIMVPCPPGKRMLVVAASGSTRSFSKSGDFMFYFQSALPGGHVVGKDESSKSLTILDCIWHHKNKTYYILDVLSWNNSHMLNCEASFRFFWLQQKMLEFGSTLDECEDNHHRFSFLNRFDCNKDELVKMMSDSHIQEEFKGSIDGFLFYDRNAPYFPGESPAAFWIKPFMVPHVFEVPESSELVAERPDDYVSVEQFIADFEKNKKKIIRKERKIRTRRLTESSIPAHVKDDTSDNVVVKIDLEKSNSDKENVETKMECSEIVESENFLQSNSEISIKSE